MKKYIYTFGIIGIIIFGTFVTGCKSDAQKERDARNELNDMLDDAGNDVQKVATAEEWSVFKKEAEIRIKENEIRIIELRAIKDKPGKVFDEIYLNKIEKLEQQNIDLQARIDIYEKNQSNWAAFKREFDHDMDELAKALKDVTVDNKN
ncbi:MAG: hypothetical protein IPH84_01600 [Bacteroidales bacterium]|nr:hypothetical protein [Bacteroidales bacterium]